MDSAGCIESVYLLPLSATSEDRDHQLVRHITMGKDIHSTRFPHCGIGRRVLCRYRFPKRFIPAACSRRSFFGSAQIFRCDRHRYVIKTSTQWLRAASGDALPGEHKFQLVCAPHRLLLAVNFEKTHSVLRSPCGSHFTSGMQTSLSRPT